MQEIFCTLLETVDYNKKNLIQKFPSIFTTNTKLTLSILISRRYFKLFAGCKTGQFGSVEVVSQSTNYNAVGEFKCPNNQYLAYFNKTRVALSKTKCLATAQWKDLDVVQCWKSGYC